MPNLILVRVHTDEGLVGCGETYYTPHAIEALIHDWMAQSAAGRRLHRHRITLAISVRTLFCVRYSRRRNASASRRSTSHFGICWDKSVASRSGNCWAAPFSTAFRSTTLAAVLDTARSRRVRPTDVETSRLARLRRRRQPRGRCKTIGLRFTPRAILPRNWSRRHRRHESLAV